MATKEKGRKWDGKSRVSNDLYRKNFETIFGKKIDNDKGIKVLSKKKNT